MIGTTSTSDGRTHPRSFSTSSSSSSSSSSTSSSHSPPLRRPRSRPSWTLQHEHKPSWLDTTTRENATSPCPTKSESFHDTHSPAQRIPKSPPSPPSSPLPLSFRRLSSAEMDSEEDHRVLRHNGFEVTDDQSTAPETLHRHKHGKMQPPSYPGPAMQESAHSKRGGSGTTHRKQSASDISNRPRFTLSTNVYPRPPAYTVVSSTTSPPSVMSTRSTNTKDRIPSPNPAKSTAGTTTTHTQSKPSKAESTRLSKSRSPTTFTTTTMSTTRRVVSTIINVSQHGDINHRKESTVTTTVVAAKGITCKADRSVRIRMKLPSVAPASGSRERTRQSSDVSSERTKAAVARCGPVKPAPNNKEAHCLITNVESGAEESSDQSVTLLPAAEVGITGAIRGIVGEVQDESTSASCRDLATPESRYFLPSLPSAGSPLLRALTLLEGPRSYNAGSENEAPSRSPQNTERLAVTPDRLEFHYPLPSPSMVTIPHSKDDDKESRDNALGSSQVALLTDSDKNIDIFQVQDFGNSDIDRHDGSTLVSTLQQKIAHTRGDKSKKTSVLAVLEKPLSNTPLIRVKDPSVMLEVMTAVKERRNSTGLMDAPSITDTNSCTENEDDIRFYNDASDNNNDTRSNSTTGDIALYETSRVTRIDGAAQNNMSTSLGPATARISLQAKRIFLQLQETRRTSVLKARQVSTTIDSSSSSSILLPAQDTPLALNEPCRMNPKNAQRDALPTYRVSPPLTPAATAYMAIPPKAATVLKSLGYPLYRSPSMNSSSTSLSSASTSTVSMDTLSMPRSSSSMSMHSSFPERLFQSRSPSPIFSSRSSMSSSSSESHIASAMHFTPAKFLSREDPTSQPRCLLSVPTQKSPRVLLRKHDGSSRRSTFSGPSPAAFSASITHPSTSSSCFNRDYMYTVDRATASSRADSTTSSADSSDYFGSPVPGYFSRSHRTSSLSSYQEKDFGSQTRQDSQEHWHPTPQIQVHDISVLTKRLANLQLMESLCPSEQQQQRLVIGAAWSSQIQQLLIHLAEQADLEEKSAHPTATVTITSSAGAGVGVSSGGRPKLPTGVYEQLLTDWVRRLDQLSNTVYKDHPGLKREVDKIRWQHGLAKRTCLVKS